MEIACEALAEQPEGVASELPEEQFLELFHLAAKRSEAGEDQGCNSIDISNFGYKTGR